MKRIVSLIIILVLFILPMPVAASDQEPVCDYADLLTAQEEQQLRDYAFFIQDTYGLETVILTIDDLGGISAQKHADDYYDYSGYGPDGILLLVAMEEREWHISTSGTAQNVFSDYDLFELEEVILPDLSNGNYYSSFSSFLEAIPEYCESYAASNQPRSIGSIVITSLIIGVVAAGAVLLVMRASMNTKRHQNSAQDYLSAGSFRITTHRDFYLYSQISKTPRQQSSSGSTTHRSSSGRSHGGRGGKF